MDIVVLQQAIKFKNSTPLKNQIEKLLKLALKYQEDNFLYFIESKHGKKPEILDFKIFFEFLSSINNLEIKDFEDIEKFLKIPINRSESIKINGNSKEFYTKVFQKVLLFKRVFENPILYQDITEIKIKENSKILAVENAELFLNIDNISKEFGFSQIVYLGGFSNTLTREFLKDKDVVFFLDYDIEAIRIYDSFECKTKIFFKHPKVEEYFSNKRYLNQKLYLKQRANLPKNHEELNWLIQIINKNCAVLEQEIFIWNIMN